MRLRIIPTSVFYAILVFGSDYRFCQSPRERTFAPGMGRVWFSCGFHFVWMRAIAGRPFARLRSESASLLLIRRGANQVGYPGRSCQIALRCALRVELGGRKLPHRCGIEDLLGLHRFRLHYDSNWVSCIFNARVKMVSFVFHSSALHSGQKLYIYLPSRHTGPPLSQSRSLWKC